MIFVTQVCILSTKPSNFEFCYFICLFLSVPMKEVLLLSAILKPKIMTFRITHEKKNMFLLEENILKKNFININFGAFDITDTTFHMAARYITTLHS